MSARIIIVTLSSTVGILHPSGAHAEKQIGMSINLQDS